MVFERNCSFCGDGIEPGTGKMYIKKDGTVFYFCKSKCQRNMLNLKRIGREIRWTTTYRQTTGRETERREEEAEEEEVEAEKPKVRKVKKAKKVKK